MLPCNSFSFLSPLFPRFFPLHFISPAPFMFFFVKPTLVVAKKTDQTDNCGTDADDLAIKQQFRYFFPRASEMLSFHLACLHDFAESTFAKNWEKIRSVSPSPSLIPPPRNCNGTRYPWNERGGGGIDRIRKGQNVKLVRTKCQTCAHTHTHTLSFPDTFFKKITERNCRICAPYAGCGFWDIKRRIISWFR